MKGKKGQNNCHFTSTEELKMAKTVQRWLELETLASINNVVYQEQ